MFVKKAYNRQRGLSETTMC